MAQSPYYSPRGGHPGQTELLTDRAIVTEAYTVIPRGVMRDIVTSTLPGWEGTRAWVLSRPVGGFASTFAQYAMEIAPGGGSDAPEPEAGVESVVFVTEGALELTLGGASHALEAGSYVYVAAGDAWTLHNRSDAAASFQWIRKAYEPLEGYTAHSFVTRDRDVEATEMPGTNGAWSTTRFTDSNDLAHDMQVNIVTFHPGGSIPFAETHVMEHGLYVLEGKAVYRLNGDWVEVQEGDFIGMRAFCPQACYAGGPGNFRYLLYKDMNRQVRLTAG